MDGYFGERSRLAEQLLYNDGEPLAAEVDRYVHLEAELLWSFYEWGSFVCSTLTLKRTGRSRWIFNGRITSKAPRRL